MGDAPTSVASPACNSRAYLLVAGFASARPLTHWMKNVLLYTICDSQDRKAKVNPCPADYHDAL